MVTEKEKMKVLNPQSWVAPFEATKLNPRLGSLKGKTIGIVGQSHEPMLYLEDALWEALPEIGDVVILEGGRFSEREGFSKVEKEMISQVRPDVVIQGIAH